MDVRSVSQSAFALISVFFERKTLKRYFAIGRSFSGVPTEEEFRKPLRPKQ